MNTRRKLMIAAAAIGLPAVAWAATVQFQNFSDSGAVIQVSGQMPGTVARLERSTDLNTWTQVAAQTVAPDGTAFLVHALTPGDPRGFYRVAAEPAPRLNSPVQIVCTQHQGEKSLGLVTQSLPNNAVPQSTHGVPYPELTTTITPLKVGNKLMVELEVATVTSRGNGGFTWAGLYRNDESAALAASAESQQSTHLGGEAGGSSHLVRLRYFVAATSTAPVTFKARVSNENGNEAVRVNTLFSGFNFGNKLVSSMTVTEIQQ